MNWHNLKIRFKLSSTVFVKDQPHLTRVLKIVLPFCLFKRLIISNIRDIINLDARPPLRYYRFLTFPKRKTTN